MGVHPANRIQHTEEYYFSKKLEEVKKLEEKGKDIINLGIGNPDLPPHPKVIKKLSSSVNLSNNHGYQSYRGLPALRQSFAQWYAAQYKVKLNPETEILPLMGSKEGIMHIGTAFTNPGDQVLIPDPGYPAYTSVSKLLSLDIQYYNLTEKKHWLPDIMELNKLVGPNCKILWLNYPHMPTGAKADRKVMQKLVKWAESKNILIVHDNPYSFILNDYPLSLFSVADEKSHILELNSLSKSHNMAGWRMGMVAGNKANINCILRVKSNFDSGMFKPLQEAACEALQLPGEWNTNLNQVYAKRREIVWKILDQINCTYHKNTAGLFVWAGIPEGYKNGVEFADFLLHSKSVFAAPGSVFGKNGENYIRISLCADEQRLTEALTRVSTLKTRVA